MLQNIQGLACVLITQRGASRLLHLLKSADSDFERGVRARHCDNTTTFRCVYVYQCRMRCQAQASLPIIVVDKQGLAKNHATLAGSGLG